MTTIANSFKGKTTIEILRGFYYKYGKDTLGKSDLFGHKKLFDEMDESKKEDHPKSNEVVIKKPAATEPTAKRSVSAQNPTSGFVNHTNRGTFNTPANTSNPIVVTPRIPEDAGFDASNRFMVDNGDGTFKPNFSALLTPRDPSKVIAALTGAEISYNDNDIESYREFIKAVIEGVLKESLVGASDNIKAILTDERLVKVMNKIYDEVLTGSIEDINHRVNNTGELETFVMNALRDICSGVIAQESGLNVEEVKGTFDQAISEDSKSTVVINIPEEPAVLDDKPVDNTTIEEQYHVLKDIEKLITYDKTHGVKFVKDEYGLIQAAVFAVNGTDDEAIEAKSFTMDLDGLIFNKDDKFWPGIEHTERPDFKRCYLLTPEMIVKFRDAKDLGEPLFGGSLPKLNKYVDIRTLFSLVDDNIDADLAQKVLVETKKAMMPNDRINKRFSKNRGIYTKASKMNETTFEFTIVFNDEYPRYVGGDPIKNTGGTGNLVVKVTTSEDNKAPVTK